VKAEVVKLRVFLAIVAWLNKRMRDN